MKSRTILMRLFMSVLAGCLALGCKPSAPPQRSATALPVATNTAARPAASHVAKVARVQGAVAKVLGVPPADIPPTASLSKLSKPIDDLDVVEIVLALEEEFHIEISDEVLVRAAGGESPSGIAAGLTVEKLTELVESLAK